VGKCIASIFLVFVTVFFPSSADAATISLLPASHTIDLGDIVLVDLIISDLGNFSSPSLGAFDVEITFDESILAFNSEIFGTLLGSSIQSVGTFTPGSIGLSEVSLESVLTLDGLQPDSFLLSTLTFDSIGWGTSVLGFGSVNIGDAMGGTLPNHILESASVTVVPLPASIWLFASAFASLLTYARRKQVV
jgi:hypothetical protein